LLQLNTAAMNQTGTGQIMNLLSNDVIRFDQLTMYLNYIWIMPFTIILHFTAIIGTIMWQKVGISSFVGIGTLIIILPGQGILSFLNLKFRTMIALLIDQRVQLMSELIAGIQVVALYFPQGLILLSESIVSFNRLEDFLLMDEVNTRRFSEITPQLQFKSQKPKEESNAENQIDRYISRNGSIVLSEHQRLSDLPVYVKLQWVSANWINGQLPPTLCNINLTIKPGQLCAVVGAVGSGKSSILHLLLKELNPGTGSIILIQGSSKYNFPGNLSTGYFTNNPNLRISYASQEPWLFSGTVRDNVLFGQSYDKARYMQVANVCALTKDFRQFPQGDMTMIGDRRVSLSGGQRARINLAVYRQANIYLLDDPLNAVDTRVARHLYEKCIIEYLHGKTRILVTHQLQFLKRVDHIFKYLLHSDIDDSNYVKNIPEAEMTAHGRVAGRVYKEYLHNGGNNFTLFVLLMIFIISQIVTTGNDY
ncbi:MRP4 protein, partial [Acromyrmex charruanus]